MKATIILQALCISAFFTLAPQVQVQARVVSFNTSESTFVYHMTSLASNYAKEHDGNLPTSWSDFEPSHPREIGLDDKNISPIQRYAFLSSPLLLQPPYEGELFFITRRPFRDLERRRGLSGYLGLGLREPGRYIVFRGNQGTFSATYVSEDYIQALFKDHPTLLPVPDTEPQRPHEIKAYEYFIVKWAALAFVIILYVFYRLVYKRRAKANAA